MGKCKTIQAISYRHYIIDFTTFFQPAIPNPNANAYFFRAYFLFIISPVRLFLVYLFCGQKNTQDNNTAKRKLYFYRPKNILLLFFKACLCNDFDYASIDYPFTHKIKLSWLLVLSLRAL